MALIDNVTFVNSLAKSLSAEFNERIPTATKTNMDQIATKITEYPTSKNEFISALTNVVGKTIVDNRLYENRYKFLHKGKLPYGSTIEMMVAEIVKGKSFSENFGIGDSPVTSLIGKEDSDVRVQYITRNVQLKYKKTISDVQLMSAFREPNGLSKLVQALITSVLNGMEFDEEVLVNKAISELGETKVEVKGYDTADAKEQAETLTRLIRETVDDMGFMSTDYNGEGIHTFSKPQDLVIFTTPKIKALLDVKLLAQAFNMDKAELNQRVVLVKEFQGEEKVLAKICDVNCIQLYENNSSSGTFVNADGLYTNMFYHRWLTLGLCKYFNSASIVSTDEGV